MSRLVMVFLIDALGYEQARDPAFLPSLTTPRAPVRSVLGYSSACIPSLLTGQLPETHGHLSMYRRAPKEGGVFSGIAPWVSIAAKLTGRQWMLRQWISSHLRRSGITGYFSLYDVPLPLLRHFDLVQRRNVYAPGAFETVEGLPDLLARRGVPHRIWDWTVSEEAAFADLERTVETGRERVLFFYRPELDGLMHTVGPNDPRVGRTLSEYSARIEAIVAKARERHDEVEVYAFGDHGMAQVDHTHDLWEPLRALPLRVPDDYLYFLDSTMARFWFRTDEARRTVRGLLKTLDFGRILEISELQELGAFYRDQEYGEMIFLLNEGHILVPSFMGLSPVRGMHGYHPDASASYTTLLTNRPPSSYPTSLLEVHRLLSESFARASA